MKRGLLSGAVALFLLGLTVIAWLHTDVAGPSFPPVPAAATPADRLVICAVVEYAARLVPLGLRPPPPPATGALPKETLASLDQRLTVLVSASTSPPELDTPDGQSPEALAIRAMLRRNIQSGPALLPDLPLPSYLSFTKLDDGLPRGGPVVAVLSFSLPGYAADVVAVHVDIHYRGPFPDSGGGGILFILRRRGATWHVVRQEGTWIS